MTLYWQNYEGRSMIDTSLRFLPLCIVGVLANVIGSACVAVVVSLWVAQPLLGGLITYALLVWTGDASHRRSSHGSCILLIRDSSLGKHL
jgi:phosphate/sulfate permease